MEPTVNTSTTSFPTANDNPATAFAAAPSSTSETAEFSSPQSDTIVTTSSSDSGGGPRRRIVMIAIALFLMVAGLASGTYLLTRNQPEPSFAWDCELYRFEVDENGSVTALNGSVRDLPAQQADVYIDGTLVATFDVPALDSGDSSSIGVVPVAEDGNFEWRVVGNKDCEHTGTFAPGAVAQCLSVKAFDEDWEALSSEELSALKEGDVVRFTIGGLTTEGTFEMARFTINGELSEPVFDKRPGTDEFYIEYVMPEDVSDFTIDADLMHSEAGWI